MKKKLNVVTYSEKINEENEKLVVMNERQL